MIKVSYESDKERYSYLKVEGHAEFADAGQDLICAAVSSIVYGLMNALDGFGEEVEIHDNEDDIEIRILSDDQTVQNYIDLVLIQLKTIEYSYGDFIKIKERK